MKNSEIILKLIRSVVFGNELDAAELKEIGADLNENKLAEIYELSSFHDVAHIVGFALKKNGLLSDLPAAQKLHSTIFKAALRCEKIVKELDALKSCLEESGIDHIALKGSVIRYLYPQPWMRTSCDIDILVREGDLDRAVAAICDKLKYRAEGKRAYHDISLYSEGGTHLELHFSIKENMDKIDTVLSQAWYYSEQCEGKKHEYRFKNEYLYFHLMAHTAYHFMHGGCGIRSFIDMLLIKQKLDVDERVLDALLEECGLITFARSCEKLGRTWFCGDPYPSELYDMDDFVISGGVYGTMSNSIAINNSSKGKGYFWRRAFLKYNDLKVLYPILEKHKILTPVFQIVRWFKIFKKDSNAKIRRELQINSQTNDSDIIRTKQMLSRLGL